MNNNLTLVVMAAGMGSRFGGLKQIEPFGLHGEILMEYGIFDALKAGFNKAVFIIKEEMLDQFKAIIGNRIAKVIDVNYVFQKLDDVPDGYAVPTGRTKPWGTAQAVASVRGVVDEPFIVINADDFYGAESFQVAADFLRGQPQDQRPYRCCMLGYRVENTLSKNGAVTRGVCQTDAAGQLVQIVERYKLCRHDNGVIYDDDTGITVPDGTPVSMNMFGFHKAVPALLSERFGRFLKDNTDPLKGEFLLPTEVSAMFGDGLLTVDVLPTTAKWYGVTYREDAQPLRNVLAQLRQQGVYPYNLWG